MLYLSPELTFPKCGFTLKWISFFSPGVNGRFLLNYQLYYLLRRLYYLQNKVYKKQKETVTLSLCVAGTTVLLEVGQQNGQEEEGLEDYLI